MSSESTREHALKQRARMKSRKPTFRRQESWRYMRVSQVWRRPDGCDSKMRRKVKGWPASARIGYRGPKMVRSLHPSGYEEVMVRNLDDLAKVDPKAQAIRFAHTVGMKKRAEISVRAEERRIHILNPLPKEKPTEKEKKTEEAEEATTEDVAEEAEKTEKEVKTEAEGENVEESEEKTSGEESKD